MLTNNIDRQKWIHGESSFLATGDYPTVDLSNRLVPQFSVRGHLHYDDEKPGCSKNLTMDDG